MTEHITVVGNIAGDPERRALPNGETIAKFRIAATTQKRQDDGAWVDAHTSWYAVSAFRRLGEHALASLQKGQRVIVSGRLRVRTWDGANGARGTEAEIDADAVGHDLLFGVSRFQRDDRHRGSAPSEPERTPEHDGWAASLDQEPQEAEPPRAASDEGATSSAPDLVAVGTWDTRPLGDSTPF